jgi:hypothetical protein
MHIIPNPGDHTMNVYIYCADIYCEDCGEAIRREITEEGHAPTDPFDECSYDSDEFPKGPYPDGGGESDSPQHCGNGEDCCNAIVLDGRNIGAWLENELTTDGVQYVRKALEESRNEVTELWAEWYTDELDELAEFSA